MAETFTLPSGLTLYNVHAADLCVGQRCVIHNPSNHHMRSWPLVWREDRGIFERICPKHGWGHPDPDQFEYWRVNNMSYEGIHGCCGCCWEPQ